MARNHVLTTFGYIDHVKQVGPNLHRLSNRSKRMVFLGYEPRTKGYRLFDPNTSRLVVSRDVIFEEYLPQDQSKVASTTQMEADVFTVQFQKTIANPAIGATSVSSNSNSPLFNSEDVQPLFQMYVQLNSLHRNTSLSSKREFRAFLMCLRFQWGLLDFNQAWPILFQLKSNKS